MNNPNKQFSSFSETVNKQNQQYLLETWKRNISSVKSADKSFSNDQALRLATILETTKRQLDSSLRKFEGTQAPDIGPFKFHVYDIITALYPTQIADELVSIQPMTQKIAQIFFLKYIYGNAKGSIRAGDSMLSPFTGAAPYNNYASEEVDGEILGSAGETDYNTFLQWVPVRPGTVVINVDGLTYTDKGNQDIVNAIGTKVGTVDYATGNVIITIPQTTENPTVDYVYNQEYAPSQTGEVNVKVEEAIITARPYKMRALYAFDAGYDLEASQGIKIDDAILEAITAELKHERDGIIIGTLFQQAANSSSWSRTIPTALTQKEHYESFLTELHMCSTRIFQDTKRAIGNWAVVGKTGMDVLNAVGAPRFVGTNVYGVAGPHYAGMLDNRLKIYFDPFLSENSYLVGYKGNLFIDAGFVVGDYLPVFASQLIMLDDFVGRRGFASVYGTKMVNNRMYVKGTIVSGT